MYIIIC